MDAALSIADSSLNAERTAITVTAENISNASTTGYAAESANITAVPGGDQLGVGAGAVVSNVAQASNALLSANNYQAQGTLSNLTSSQMVLSAIQDVFPLGQGTSASTSSSANSSIAGQLSTFWSDWDDINSDPSAAAPRSQVLEDAQALTETLNEASTQLSQLQTNTTAELDGQVGTVNQLLTQAATLNQSILTVSTGGGDPSQLNDQMTAVLDQLSSYAGVSVRTQSNGTTSIGINGVNVVQGNEAQQLSVSTTAGVTTVTADPGAIPVSLTSGSMAGLISGLNQDIPQYQGQLDTVANNLESLVNTQLASGYTASGTAGDPMFTGTGAANISVNSALISDPTLIAAATQSGAAATNDGSNAQAMAELGTAATGPDLAYQNLVQSLGAANQSVNAQVTAQTSVANQSQAALSASTGVNLDTELTNLMNYQQNYEASAKLLTTVQQTMESLISAV